MNIKLTEQKNRFILNNLDLTNKKLAELNDVSEGCIEQFLKRNSIKKGRKKIKVNESYFEKINNSHQAYVLGLIYSDGWNNISGNRWGIQLQETDLDILKKISEVIKYKGTIKTLKPSCKNGKPRKRLEVCSKKMCSDLLKLGVFQKKSLILDFNPDLIPKKFMNYFFRGVFDGDGSLYIKGSQKEARITSSLKFCYSCQDFFKSFLKYEPKIYFYKKSKQTGDLRFKGHNKVKLFLDWIYSGDLHLKIDRKYKKYRSLSNSSKEST